jgi:hypothetical protein
MQFSRALGWAEDRQLIAIAEIDGIIYLRLSRPDPEQDVEEQDQRPLVSPETVHTSNSP